MLSTTSEEQPSVIIVDLNNLAYYNLHGTEKIKAF